MKRLLLWALLLSTVLGVGALVAAERIGTGQILVINSATGTPVSLSPNTNIFAVSVTVLGKKGARTDNTGIVYIGPTSGNDEQPYAISAGEEVIIRTDGGTIDLKYWYLDVSSAGDGVIVLFTTR